MPDNKLINLTEETSPAATDLLYLTVDPTGTPGDRKASIENLTSASKAYGEIYVEGNVVEEEISGSSVDFSNAVQVSGWDTNGDSFNSTPDHTNDHITADIAGEYFISLTASFNGGTNDTYSFGIFANNKDTQLLPRVTRKVSSTDVGAIACAGIASLAVNDTVELWVQCENSSDNVTIQDGTLALFKIGP